MAIKEKEIKDLILNSIPDAEIDIKDLMGDNNHYSAVIKSKIFKGMNKIFILAASGLTIMTLLSLFMILTGCVGFQ